MPLDIPAGERCFLDANILYYCFVETPDISSVCRGLLMRVQSGALVGVTNTRALGDCVHKTMLAEICQRFGRSRDRLVGWLKQHPESLENLPKSAEICSRLAQLRLVILPSGSSLLASVIEIVQSERLLMGDAEIVAMMQQHGITHLATNDDDFDRVPGITVWKPRT